MIAANRTPPPADGSAGRPDAPDRPATGRIDRRRIDDVFGETWPSTTEDERDPAAHNGFDAEHYRRARPPHHVA